MRLCLIRVRLIEAYETLTRMRHTAYETESHTPMRLFTESHTPLSVCYICVTYLYLYVLLRHLYLCVEDRRGCLRRASYTSLCVFYRCNIAVATCIAATPVTKDTCTYPTHRRHTCSYIPVAFGTSEEPPLGTGM